MIQEHADAQTQYGFSFRILSNRCALRFVVFLPSSFLADLAQKKSKYSRMQ
jgi:hypothetical protein